MNRTMFDAAFLPDPAPSGYDCAAGYIWQAHQEAAHIWSHKDWARAASSCRYLLPIATCWTPFGNGAADAVAAIKTWESVVLAHGWPPQRCALALDMELSVALRDGADAYATSWRAGVRSRGYQDIVYSSYSGRRHLGLGPVWLGPPSKPNEVDSQTGNIVLIAQEQYLGTIDLNHVSDGAWLFDTKGKPRVGDPMPSGNAVAVRTAGAGYYVFSSTGKVYAYGCSYHGGIVTSPTANPDDKVIALNAPIVDAVVAPGGEGYAMLGQDGGVFAFGTFKFQGAPVGIIT